MSDKLTMVDRLEASFRARPWTWIDGRELGRVAGFYGWRSRVSDLRARGLRITNRIRRIKTTDGVTVAQVSEYRFEPPTNLLDLAEARSQTEASC
jgi:hypothetical protein